MLMSSNIKSGRWLEALRSASSPDPAGITS
jgi:hypothetical protein